MSNEKNLLFDKMKKALIGFEVETLKGLVLDAIVRGITAEEIIETLSSGMNIIGERYQSGEFFVTELILAGETMEETLKVLEPHITEEPVDKVATVVIASVAGDIHDIGKNIFAQLMRTAGFEVIDLGVDVPADKIVEAVKEYNADILGLSALLTTNLEQFSIVVKRLESKGVRDKVKVIIGGATVTEEYAKETRVDAYVKTALEGVEICRNWADKKIA
ncbi:MAG: cobalamin B12-binding domain-containing protein [Candidatus Thorarchaeota archaeon]|jgi:5-methyltetrahydrofolate--homocysteine methyltransferase